MNTSDGCDIQLGCAEREDGTLKDAHEIVWYKDADDDVPMPPQNEEAPRELGCAENADGTLKDATEMEWFHDADDEVPMPPPPAKRKFIQVEEATQSEPRQRQRRNSRKEGKNPFVDLEAEVEDGDEGCEDDNVANDEDDGFINDKVVDEESDSRVPHEYRQPVDRQSNPFVDDLERWYARRESGVAMSTVDPGEELPRLVDGDEGLWEARVPMGKETQTIIALMSKASNNESRIPLYPKSVFSRKGLPGRIFFESNRITPIRRLCEGIKGIKSIAKVVETVQWVEMLTMPYHGHVPKMKTWVRMRRGVHKGDIAYVYDVEGRTLRPMLLYIPRIEYKTKKRVVKDTSPEDENDKREGKEKEIGEDEVMTNVNDGRDNEGDGVEGKDEEGEDEEEEEEEEEEDKDKEDEEEREREEERQREQQGKDDADEEEEDTREVTVSTSVSVRKATKRPRPPARLFDIQEAREHNLRVGKKIIADMNLTVCRRKTYDAQGFCVEFVDSSAHFPEEANPTIEELHPFLDCDSIPAEERRELLRCLECARMTEGTKVKVQDTEHANKIGIVEGLYDDVAAVRITPGIEVIRFHVSSLRRHFESGDTVKIIAGEHKDITGWVTHVYEDIHMAYIHNDRTHLDYSYPLHFLEAVDNDFVHAKAPKEAKMKMPDMRDKMHSHLVGLEVLIIEGVYKGYWGHVQSISTSGQANVALQGKHILSGRMERVPVEQMFYRNGKIDINWHRLDKKNKLVIEPKAEKFVNMSLIGSTYPDTDEIKHLFFPTHSVDVLTRLEERELGLPKSSAWQIDELDREMQRQPETITRGHWLERLNKLEPKPVRIYLQISAHAKGQGSLDKYVGQKGYFKALGASNVSMGYDTLPDIEVPYRIVEPSPPDRALKHVIILKLGDLFGKRMVVAEYPGNRPDTICTVREAPRQGKRRVPLATYKVELRYLAMCSDC